MRPEDIQKLINERGINSMEQLQALLDEIYAKQNSIGLKEFLGLSPNQMQQIIYGSFEPGSVMAFKTCPDEVLDQIPFFRMCEEILKHTVLAKNPFKLTASTSALPVKTVQALYDTGIHKDEGIEKGYVKLYKETDCNFIHIAKFVLELTGVVRKVHGKWNLTKNGEKLTKPGARNALFQAVFLKFLHKFNWAFLDFFPEMPQEFGRIGAGFSLAMFANFGDEARGTDFYCDHYMKAFPAFETQVISFQRSFHTLEDAFHSMYELRVVQRFADWFGFVEIVEKRELLSKTYSRIRKTGVLEEVFNMPLLHEG